MTGVEVEARVRSLLANYATRAEFAPEPPPSWADVVRDLQEALGHARTYVAPEDRTGLTTARAIADTAAAEAGSADTAARMRRTGGD